MNKPTAVSFFCGAGGMDLGFIQAGFEIKAAWDWDNYAVQSYYHNIGEHVNQMDIKEMTYDDIPNGVDCWIFGSPCQDISVAGKKKGLVEGEQSSMFFHVMRLVDEMIELNPDNVPKVLLMENVKNLKKYLPIVEGEFKKRGFTFQAKLFNSKYWNVAQNRERYFCVGIREDLPQTFKFPEEQKEYVPKLIDFLETEVEEKYYLNKLMYNMSMEGDIPVIGTTAKSVVREDGSVIKDKCTSAWVHETHKRIGTLSARDYKEPKQIIVPFPITNDGATYTLSTRSHDLWDIKNIEKKQTTVVIHVGDKTYRIRKLTPKEYARLQGFPDSYEQVVSNTQFYKQMGNAVSVPVAEGTALKIKEYLESL